MSTNTTDTDTAENGTKDALGIPKYDIEGYDWHRTPADEIGEGDLLPGQCEEVYKIQQEAGYSISLDETYYVTLLVDKGDMSWLGGTPIQDEDDLANAMQDRVDVTRIPDEAGDAFIWTVTPTDN